ncbi:hypothetical protein [Marinobacter sp.]|uniref:hypothetical protein n=1 Tax=Marinobacter sp. TaxID=50741 RepID=UPI0035674E1B
MIGRGLAIILIGALSSQSAAADWEAYDHLSERSGNWTVYDRKAGVTGPSDTRTFLMASVHCAGENTDALRLSFGSLISRVYRLYFVSELVPAIQGNRADLSISVDDGEKFPLQYHNASIDNQNQLTVSGMLVSENSESEALNALMSGRQATFSLSYNGNLLLTQKFTLSNSSDALSSLKCPEPTTTVADSQNPMAADQPL